MQNKIFFIFLSLQIIMPQFGRALVAKNHIESQLQEQEQKQKEVLSLLYQLNRKIKKTATEKARFSHERNYLQVQIQNLLKRIKKLQNLTQEQKQKLQIRFRIMAQMSDQVLVRTFFGAASPAEMERNLRIVNMITQKDFELAKEYSNNLKKLSEQKQILSDRLKDIKSLESRLALQEQLLYKEQNTKKNVLQKIKKQQMFSLQEIQRLQRSQKDSGVADLLSGASFFDFKGQLSWPLQGSLRKTFGLIKDESHKYTLPHKGLFIEAHLGQPIHAIFEGLVSFVGFVDGLGQTLILDHGDNYYSVYANTDHIQVATGQMIQKNQILAYPSYSLLEAVTGLYFEIRHFTEATDPLEWLKGQL